LPDYFFVYESDIGIAMSTEAPDPPSMLNPLNVLQVARQAVPAVDFALGAAGIAAAASIILYFVGRGPAAFIILGGTFGAMILLFVFAAIVKSGKDHGAGTFLIWAVVLFFTVFLAFTVTAFVFGSPAAWAHLLGIESLPTSNWSFSNCEHEEGIALADFNQNPANTSHAQSLINCKNPMGYNLEGERDFFLGNYAAAEQSFTLALQNFPSGANPPISREAWQSNLANTYIETGKNDDALKILSSLVDKNPTNNDYRLSRGQAEFYKAKFDPAYYRRAIETLNSVNPNLFSSTERDGRVQILLAAAKFGQSRTIGIPDQQRKELEEDGTKDWCAALKRQSLWVDYLKGAKPYTWASLTEEKRLLAGLSQASCKS
jgi:hypothetical protein